MRKKERETERQTKFPALREEPNIALGLTAHGVPTQVMTP
jgi:hypothetical protein